MDTKIIAVCNHKGGVAKTTTVASLGSALASLGYSVLLVDLDAQSNLTSSLLGYEPQRSTYEALRDREGLPIEKGGTSGVDLAGASLDLAGIELEISTAMERERILQDVLAEVKDKYQYILLDCPPSLGLLTLNALTASDTFIVPIQCEYYALEGLSQLMSTVRTIKRLYNEYLELEGVLLTMYDGRLNLTQQVVDEVKNFFPKKVYATVIPRNVRLSEAPSFGLPIIKYDITSQGAHAYFLLAKEVIESN